MGVLSRVAELGTLSEIAEMNLLAQAYEFRWAIALTGVGAYILQKLRTYWRLRRFRGPFGTGFFGLWYIRANLSGRAHIKYREVTETYGSVARVSPHTLVTSDPDFWMHVNSVRSKFSRAPWFYKGGRIQAGKDHIVSQIDETKHKSRRQQMAPGYSGKENSSLESSIDIHVGELMDLIRRKYTSTEATSKPMDFAQKVSFMTLDVISRIGFGEPFGSLRADRDVDGFLEASNKGLPLMNAIAVVGLSPIMQIPWVFRLVGPNERDKAGLGKMLANARRIIEKRVAEGIDVSKKSDMLSSFMRHGLDKEDLVTEACLQIIAGADTTSSSLRGIMLYLVSNPRVYAKLQREVDATVADGSAAPSPAIIPDTVARKLPYLQAVIKEGIRIHPPVTSETPKRVPAGGEVYTVDGNQVHLPGGIDVGLSILGMFRRQGIFGEDVDLFRPERWLVEDEGKLATMNRTVDLVFSYGKYQCLGRPIALMEMGKTVFELMRNFDWCIANPEQPWKEYNYAGLYQHEDMLLLATDRGETAR